MKNKSFDILIIGGGINGCGIAHELAARGYSVCLAEKNDIASATSSWSTKLIHGGLRYLEHYEFRLVREALKEREVLMRMAPHLIRPIRFVLPYLPEMRPKWLLRIGLFIYDNLGGRNRLSGSRTVNLKKDRAGKCLKENFSTGFEYSDCFVDDSRLTIANAIAAAEFSADIRRDCEVTKLDKYENGWIAETTTGLIKAKLVINASGPWADNICALYPQKKNLRRVRLVRGSHLITKKLFEHDKAYIFQNSDGRILFAIPYLSDFTLVGTTDIDHANEPDNPQISEQEIKYICTQISHYLERPLTESDIVSTYSGVRPLYDDGKQEAQSVTRDYVLEWQQGSVQTWLNIFGGKLTTYRKLSLAVAAMIDSVLPAPHPYAADSQHLPGGDLSTSDIEQFSTELAQKFPNLPTKVINRMSAAYGSRIHRIIGTADKPYPLGRDFGNGLYQAEIDYLVKYEWARTTEDILFRRTKLGLYFDKNMTKELTAYLTQLIFSQDKLVSYRQQ